MKSFLGDISQKGVAVSIKGSLDPTSYPKKTRISEFCVRGTVVASLGIPLVRDGGDDEALDHSTRQGHFIGDAKLNIGGLYWVYHNLGLLYPNQGKLSEAEKMYIRALQGYEEALGPDLIPSYLPALHAMTAFGDLYSKTDRKDMAKAMYTQALSGYTAVQGPSSNWGKKIEGRLQALQLAPSNTKTGTSGQKPLLKRLFRRLRT